MKFEADPSAEPEPGDRQKEVLAIYNRFHAANRHKMDPIPVCNIPVSLKN
jgi:NAD+ synthase